LVTPNAADATLTFDAAAGSMAFTEPTDGRRLGAGVLIDPARVLRTATVPAFEKSQKNANGLLLTQVAEDGYVRYRAGFAWSSDGDITTPEQRLIAKLTKRLDVFQPRSCDHGCGRAICPR